MEKMKVRESGCSKSLIVIKNEVYQIRFTMKLWVFF